MIWSKNLYNILIQEQQFIKAKDLAERDLIGEHIDGCYAKMRYIQEQFTELRNTIAGIDNENTKVSLFCKSFTSLKYFNLTKKRVDCMLLVYMFRILVAKMPKIL